MPKGGCVFIPNLRCVVFRIYFFRGKDTLYAPFFIDDKSSAECAHVGAAAHFLLSPHTERLDPFLFGVGNEVEGQVLLGNEVAVRTLGIHAHAEHFVATCYQCLITVAQAASLCGTAGRAVFGVEIECKFLAFEIA